MASVSEAVSGMLKTIKSKEGVAEEVLGVEINLAGVTFDGRQDMIRSLDSRAHAVLVRESDNPYDPNAVKVVATPWNVQGDLSMDIGYIPKRYAPSVASLLDAGEEIDIRIKRVIGGEDGCNYGIVTELQRRGSS